MGRARTPDARALGGDQRLGHGRAPKPHVPAVRPASNASGARPIRSPLNTATPLPPFSMLLAIRPAAR